jgi:hypothetical protein
MSDPKKELTDALDEFVKRRTTVTVIPAKVLSVDSNALTCNVEDIEENEVFDVRLRATLDGVKKGFVLLPKVGSSVLIANIGNSKNAYFVVAYSEVTKVTAWMDETKFEVDTAGLLLQKGEQTLRLILNDILNQIKLITVPVTTAPGTSGPPVNAAAFDLIKQRVEFLLKAG